MPRKGERVYHRKDGLWEARYIKDIDATGKKKYGSVYARTYREVKEKRQNIEDNIRLYNRPLAIRNMTISQLVNEWLFLNRNRLKISTYQRYLGFLNNHIEDIVGKQPVIFFSTIAVHEFALNRLESGLQPQSVNSILTFLHACLRYGHRQYNLPLPDIIYLTPNRKEMRVLTADEQRKLVSYLNEDMDIYKFGVLLALYTGLRIGELCGLRWEDIEDNRIKIKRTVQRINGQDGRTELHIGTPKTTTSAREIPIPSFLLDKINHYHELNQNCEYVIALRKDEITDPRVMQYKFKKFLKAANIEKANFHSLRHTFATRCIECGFEVKSLSEILGHTKVNITLNRYVHSSFELKLNNMEKLSQIV
ncbi:MAG: tyrosine-type recombinase/integrase [Clostridia bacterium]|nr:tyrosine-type recombinase/integrase [Clostridia bacterium]